MATIEKFILRRCEIFTPTRYEEYQNGEMIASGGTSMQIKLSPIEKGSIKCELIDNNLPTRIMSIFSFDTCITLHDRLLMVSIPKQTNADIPVVGMLTAFTGYTKDEKIYLPIEPVVGSIFVSGKNIVKVSFTLSNPERLIELYKN